MKDSHMTNEDLIYMPMTTDEERFNSLERARLTMESDLKQVHATLATLPTKTEMAELKISLLERINEMLQEALASRPNILMARWTKYAVIVAALAFGWTLLHG